MWLGLAAFATVLLIPVALVMRRAGHAPAQAAPAATTGFKAPAGTTSLVWCYGALGFGYILPATFLPVMARSVVADPRLFGLAWPVFGITAAASTFVAGWALRHASRLRVWAVSHLLMGVGVLLPSLWLTGATIALSALMVGGTFMIVTMVGVQEMRTRAAGGNAAALVARTTAAFALGQIAGPIASSLLLHMPALAANGLALALQLAAASLFVTAVWLWRFDRLVRSSPEMSHAR
jgi:predicted MFS family arabinose efflux permease